jgi:hypothetical protein
MKKIIIPIQVYGVATLMPWVLALVYAPILLDAFSIKIIPYAIIIFLFFYPFLMFFCYWYAWKTPNLWLAVLLSVLPPIILMSLLSYLGLFESS